MTDIQEDLFGDPTTAPFWEAAKSHRLVVQRCRDCGHHQFYPRPFCLSCESKAMEWHEVTGRGTVYSMSEVHMAPAPDIETPYVIAIVQLDEGPKFMTNIVNGSCEIGSKVRVAWRDRQGKPPVPDFQPETEGD